MATEFFIDPLEARIKELEAEVAILRESEAISDKLIAARNEVLLALECPVHGECVPGALEKIAELKNENKEAKKHLGAMIEMCDGGFDSSHYGPDPMRMIEARIWLNEHWEPIEPYYVSNVSD